MARPGRPTSPPSEEQLTIAPLPWARLTQLVFHAAPDAAEIDRDGAIEFVAAGVGGLHGRSLHAGIVERRIQPTEGGHRLVEHGLDLRFIGHVAAKRHRFVTCGEQLLCSRPCRSLIDICHDHGRARGSESLRGHEPDALSGAGHERYLTFEGQVRWCRVAHMAFHSIRPGGWLKRARLTPGRMRAVAVTD